MTSLAVTDRPSAASQPRRSCRRRPPRQPRARNRWPSTSMGGRPSTAQPPSSFSQFGAFILENSLTQYALGRQPPGANSPHRRALRFRFRVILEPAFQRFRYGGRSAFSCRRRFFRIFLRCRYRPRRWFRCARMIVLGRQLTFEDASGESRESIQPRCTASAFVPAHQASHLAGSERQGGMTPVRNAQRTKALSAD